MTSIKIQTLSVTEIDNVHAWMANLFRSFGMQGDELDHAIVGAFSPAIQSIDRHRLSKLEADAEAEAKRAHLKVVGQT